MAALISETYQRARKDYHCEASQFLRDSGIHKGIETGLTFSEFRQIIKARKNGWRIAKGEKYLRQFSEIEGSLYTFKAIPAIHEICIRLELYPNDY